jgi:hypothetical protein
VTTPPTLSRWTSLDPIRYAAEDVNLYRMVFNAPTVLTDTDGLFAFPVPARPQAELLKDGPMPLAEICDQAEAADLGWRIIRRARESLGIVPRKKAFCAGWK